MGAGLSRDRYMGGKKLRTYYIEDLLPVNKDIFHFFSVNDAVAYASFLLFVHLDEKESGLIESKSLTNYFHGGRSKFTERVFHQRATDSEGNIRTSFSFREYFIALWSYCSLSYRGIARYIYEIFDADNNDSLTKHHVKAIFRMLYCTEAVEEENINYYSFSAKGTIDKLTFMDTSNKFPLLIQPAINYQTFLQQRIGGRGAWRALISFRTNYLHVYDRENETLAESLSSMILAAEQLHEQKQPATSTKLLNASSKKLQAELDFVNRELRLREQQVEDERRRASIQDPSLPMKRAWAAFEAKKRTFDDDEFLIDDVWRRREARLQLFTFFDEAVSKSHEYYEWKDKKDIEIAEGTPDDHKARYNDFLNTEQGKTLFNVLLLLRVYELALDQVLSKFEKLRRKPSEKSERHAIVENGVNEFTRIYEYIRIENELNHTVSISDRNKQFLVIQSRQFDEEVKCAKKMLTKSEFISAESSAHQELCVALKMKTIEIARRDVANAKEERYKDYMKSEAELSMKYGSRVTRWEYVLEKRTNKYFYVNIDTLESRHPKTAICEQCDAFFVQHELRCGNCNAPRSSKNLLLYRPLGFKDITLE